MNVDVLVILGPTAVGKTAAGLLVAETLGGEIISCDSMQIYRGMDIGTAKPTLEEQQRVPFHLIDIVSPSDYYSAASYQGDARKAIDAIRGRGKWPIIVGGTGLYLRALLEGFGIPPSAGSSETRNRLKQELQETSAVDLYERLKHADPLTASRLNPNDSVRVIRALEVYETTGIPISAQQTRDPLPLKVKRYGLTLNREKLYARIDERVDAMLEAGWEQEVSDLLDQGYSPDLPPLKSLGYRHLIARRLGQHNHLTYQETINLIKRDTRRFAKRQMTWFRKEPEVQWIDIDEQGGVERVASQIGDAL